MKISNGLRSLVSRRAVVGGLAWCVCSLCGEAALHAVTITQWNFNGAIATPVNSPATSTGAGTATPVGMNGGANNADIVAAGGTTPSTDPGTPNNAWRVRGSQTNGWSGTTQLLSGAQFNVSTAGSSTIEVNVDVQATDGSPRHGQFQYTVDGSTFTSFGPLVDFNDSFDSWKTLTYDLSSIAAVNNNPAFGFKLVSAFSPVEFTNANGVQPANTAFQRASGTSQVYNGTAGNWRFDMVTVNAVPEPSSLALGGLAVAAVGLVRRRKNCE
jgi:hypothetical protein